MDAKPVLLAEGDEDSRIIYSTILSHHGIASVQARTGPEALERARGEAPGLIVIEHVLPVEDGWSVVQRLERDPRTAGIPVVFMLSQDPEPAFRAQIESRCATWLVKPCTPLRMLTVVRSWMEDRVGAGGLAAQAPVPSLSSTRATAGS